MPAPPQIGGRHRVPMPRRPPALRIRDFQEVALGYDEGLALEAARRCLQCPEPGCRRGCPVGIDIPGFIRRIAEGRPAEALRVLRKFTSLPGVCGRVCPAEEQCESMCVLGKAGEPVDIGGLERFAADAGGRDLNDGVGRLAASGLKVAVVGSGPAGITAAGDLAKLGHHVTLYEALHKPGGVLTYGIPEFRLPKKVVDGEIDYLKKLGVRVETNIVVGRTLSLDELFTEGHEAVFIGIGAGTPDFLGIPGENLGGVYSANEFLTRANLMEAYRFPQADTPLAVGRSVVVIGGGNVAMDAARTARRLSPGRVTVVYRRSRAEMPARPQEVSNAEEEGVEFIFLANPFKMVGDTGGRVSQLECLRMRLGEPDESGRRAPAPIPGSSFLLEADTVVVAIGSRPNPLVKTLAGGIDLTPEGLIITDPLTARTSREGVWAGGDIVTGEATVISAMGAGKRAAMDIHRWLTGKPRPPWKAGS